MEELKEAILGFWEDYIIENGSSDAHREFVHF